MRQNDRQSSNDDQHGKTNHEIEKLFHTGFTQGESLVCDKCHSVYSFEKPSRNTEDKSKWPVCPHCVGKPERLSLDRVRLEKIKLEIGWKDASSEARNWWLSIESGQNGDLKSSINLANQLTQRGSSIEEIYRAYCHFKTMPMVAILLYMEFLRGRLADLTGADFEENLLPHNWLQSYLSGKTSNLTSESPTIVDINATTGFEVILTSFGNSKLNVLKVVKNATGKSLIDAKKLVEAAPTTIGRARTHEDAAKVVQEIQDAGGQARIA